MSNPIKKLLGQTAVYGLTVIVSRMINFLLLPLYVYVFEDTKDYGVISILYSWVAFLIVLLPFGMETTFFKFFSDKENEKERIFQNSFLTVIGINVLFFLIVLFCNQSFADWMLLSDHRIYVILLAAIVCLDAISALPLAKLRSENRPKDFAKIQVTSIAVNVILNVILLLGFFDKTNPEQGIIFILVANLLSSLVKPLMVHKDFLNLKFVVDFTLIKQMLWYALPLVVAGLAGIVNETIDRILLNQLLYDSHLALPHSSPQQALEYSQSKVGIYSANYKLAMLVTILLQAYRYAAEPFFFSNAKNQDRNKLYAKVMNYFIAAVCLVFLLVSLNIQIFKYFIPNQNYWDGLTVVPILLLANVFLGIYFNQSIWYKLSGQTKFGAFIAIGGAILTIGLNVLLIPKYGYIASAWATLIVYGAQMIASYLLGQKYYPIKYNIRKFGLYFGFALLLFFVAKMIAIEDGILQFVVNNTLILIFALLVYIMEKPQNKSQEQKEVMKYTTD
jgi:O-antigen/teichoic acid export membrane protein